MRKLLSIGLLLLLAGAAATESQAQTGFRRIEDVIYSRKFGTALTLDVFQPEQPNGCGILFMVSGGGFSPHDGGKPWFFLALLERGYTGFAVLQRSRPKITIPEN